MPNKKSSPIATPETVTLDAYEQSIEDALDATKMTSQLTPAMRRQIQGADRRATLRRSATSKAS